MKLASFTAALICSLGFATLVQAAPTHQHAGHVVHAAVPVPAQRWATDAPLRDGMGRVHAALDELRHYEMGHMSQTMALDRVATIEKATAYMFANCKLAPAADAALHGMLVPLLAATQTFKKHPQEMAAVAVMRDAVVNYPRYFDDPGWTADAKPAPLTHDGP